MPFPVIECPFCGFRTDEWDIDSHLSECEEAKAVQSIIGKENMRLPETVVKGRSTKGYTFLKVRNLTKGKDTLATIVGFGEADKGMPYSDYLIDIQIGKTRFTHGFRTHSEDLQAIAKAYGEETSDWNGKEVVLTVGEYTNAEGKVSDIVVMRPNKSKRSK
jgi:hypothetical protein